MTTIYALADALDTLTQETDIDDLRGEVLVTHGPDFWVCYHIERAQVIGNNVVLVLGPIATAEEILQPVVLVKASEHTGEIIGRDRQEAGGSVMNLGESPSSKTP